MDKIVAKLTVFTLLNFANDKIVAKLTVFTLLNFANLAIFGKWNGGECGAVSRFDRTRMRDEIFGLLMISSKVHRVLMA